jgi:hypothetical protein
MTTNCSRDDAAFLNNQGVVCLDRGGDTLQAQKFFRKALIFAMKELHAPSTNEFSPPIGLEPTYFGTCIGLDQQQDNNHIPGPLHLQAFPICRRNFSRDPLVDRTICASIIVFNLALVYHRKDKERYAEGFLEKARSLYETCYRLLSEKGGNKGSTGDLLVDLLCMAVLNNLAYISFDMSDYLHSTEYSNGLIRFALSVASSSSSVDSTQVSIALDQHKGNFLLNAMILRSPVLAPAA